MSKIDPTMVDVDAIIDRIKRVQAGELPKDNVSIEELRAAIEAQRQRREAKIVVGKEPKTTVVKGKKLNLDALDLDSDDLFGGI